MSGLLAPLALSPAIVHAACPALDTSKGTVTQTVDVAGSYRVWSRIKPDAATLTNNSYYLEIDSNNCGIDVGNNATTSAIPANTWTWVDYQAGNTASKIDVTLTAGTHTFKMIGKEDNVQLDRILLLSSTDTCLTSQPTGNGDNCTTVASNVPPTVSVTAPANNAIFTAPATINITTNPADSDGTISKVEFFQGTTKLGESLSSPYSFAWTNVAAGTYALTAKATDNSGATTPSVAVNVTVSGTTPPPPTGTTCSTATPCSIWTSTETPTNPDTADNAEVELGLKFRSDTAGSITGVRFYKSAANVGTHVGSLWTTTGTRLASATFAGETASGWQQVNFATPVGIAANTTYIVSYNAPVGHYAGDTDYFATSTHDKPPLHARANGAGDANSVYKYGPAGSFPTDTYLATNYWVDALFANTVTPTGQADLMVTAVTATPSSPAPGQDVVFSATIKNQGTAPTPDGVIHGVLFSVDGTAVSWSETYVAALAPGESRTQAATSGPSGLSTWSATAGSHTITAYVDDVNRITESNETNNTATISLSVSSATPDTQAPTVPANLTATAQSASRVDLTWTASTDNVGVTGYYVIRNGVTVASLGPLTTYSDPNVSPSTSYSYVVEAFDAAGNVSAPANPAAAVTTPALPDTLPPTTTSSLTAAALSYSQINLSWADSTDNVGVTGYDVYRSSSASTPVKIATVTTTSFGDSGLTASTTYSYYIVARDAAGNTSPASSTASATTKPLATTGSVSGTVSGNNGPLSGASITVTVNGVQRTYTTNSSGNYTITGLPPASYSVRYSARYYYGQTISVPVGAGANTIQNVTLRHR